MKDKLIGLALLLSSTSYAGVTLECDKAFGEAVYSSFTLSTEINDQAQMPYDFSLMIGTTLMLNGKANLNHPDIIPSDDEYAFSYVTLGSRATVVKKDLSFHIETCKDCDINSAEYRYQKSNEGEIYITEMYGSDGSGDFSVYTCVKAQ
jgi:hypothetical protein